ncbi:MAG: acyltransferase family protein [Acidobacteriota bacterium]
MSKRSPELDILRAIAVLLVMGRHLPGLPEDLPQMAQSGFLIWMKCGWIGVDLFFVLSGFLVSGLIFREQLRDKTIHIGNFLVRRGLKIYPAFYVFLAVTVMVDGARGLLTWRFPIFIEAVFLQNYGPALWNHTWSLAVEEHFYLLLALLLFLLKRIHSEAADPFKWIKPIAIGICLLLLALRIVHAQGFEYSNKESLYPSHLRIDSLLFGVLLSYGYHFHRSGLVRWLKKNVKLTVPVSLALVSTSLVFDVEDAFMHTAGLSCLYVGFGLLMLHFLVGEGMFKNHFLSWFSWLKGMGYYSYSIYLWHMPMERWGLSFFRRLLGTRLTYPLEVLLYVVGSLCLGVLMARAVEAPGLRLRDRLFPSRSGSLK